MNAYAAFVTMVVILGGGFLGGYATRWFQERRMSEIADIPAPSSHVRRASPRPYDWSKE